MIHRGRIRITLEPEDDVPFGEPTKAEELSQVIGSLCAVKPKKTAQDREEVDQDVNSSRVLSCALSVVNFRKLKARGCKLSDDPHTRQVVAKLREQYDAYLAESAAGKKAKAGQFDLEYRFKLPPFKHQILGFHFLHAVRTPALFGDCGTGKTGILAFFADSLIKDGQDYVFIVVCPINLIQHVWIEEIERFYDLEAFSLREPTENPIRACDWDEGADRDDPVEKKKARNRATLRRRKLIDERFATDAKVYVLNYEQIRLQPIRKRLIKLCQRHFNAGKKLCLVIDESTRIKTRTSATYRALKAVRDYCERCIIVTGTPAPNGILDLWAQFSILDDGMTLQPSFVDYRKGVAVERELRGVTWVDRQGKTRTAMKWFPRPGASLEVYKTIEPRMIRFRIEDCIDLPPSRFIVRDVELNQEQLEAYESMETMLYTELEEGAVTAKAAVVKLMKLREITGGFVVTDDRREVQLGKDSPKMLELDELLAQSIADRIGNSGPPRKALVWIQYQWEAHRLLQRYRTLYGARGLFGGISTSAKDDAIRRFRTDPGCRILICHPASAGHGLTLTEASFSFYYSLSYNYEEFFQSQRRIARPGQTRPMTFFALVAPRTIDENLLSALSEKKSFSDFIADGKFSRADFLGRRDRRKTAQIDLASWEVNHETPVTENQ